jgi:diguanylate cyclase (GGDEF)-like protein
LLAALTGVLVLFGWAIDSSPLTSLGLPIAMNPATASCFVLLSAALWLRRRPSPSRREARLAEVFAASALATGAIRLVAYFDGARAYVDDTMFGSELLDNRMAPNTALCFALLGFSLLQLDREGVKARRQAELPAVLVGVVALFAILGYAYDVTELYGVLAFIPMAINTAVCFLALAVGTLAARPDRGIMQILTSDAQGGAVARRLLPATILVPTLLGWLLLRGERGGLYSARLGITMFAVLCIVILGVLVLITARLIHGLDHERRQAATALEQSVQALKASKAEIESLSELSGLLQACGTDGEVGELLSRFAPRLFSLGAGAFYTLASSRNLLEVLASWGPDPQPVIFPEACWAFRRGRVHSHEQASMPCQHVEPAVTHAICAPLIANGDTLGTFYLHDGNPGQDLIVAAVAERVALALANLRLRETLKTQAIRDHLTGLYNRRFMEETLERELKRAARAERPVSLLMCDVDHFKAFNDRHGHTAGDELLAEVGRLLTSSIRGADVPCRYGGEEFLLILPDMPLEGAIRRAEQVCVAVRGLSRQVTISIGVAAYPNHGETPNELVRAADGALYLAKGGGRDRVEVASDSTPKPYRASGRAKTRDR